MALNHRRLGILVYIIIFGHYQFLVRRPTEERLDMHIYPITLLLVLILMDRWSTGVGLADLVLINQVIKL